MNKLALLLAPALLTLFLAGCKNNQQPAAAGENTGSAETIAAAKDLTIAYVDFDTLIANYNLYKDMSRDFQTKSSRVENEITTKGRSLERDFASYQERMSKGLLTALQARTLEEDLSKKQQEFIAYRDRVVSELTEEETVMLNQIQYNIQQFVKEYNKDRRFSMILYTNSNGPILDADPSLDITTEFVSGLNKLYQTSASTPAATPAQ